MLSAALVHPAAAQEPDLDALFQALQAAEGDNAKAIEGRVNQRRVWIRVEPVDDLVTSVVVQARTSAGGTDRELAHDLEKQIAIRLTVD